MKKNSKILVGATLLASAAILAGCTDEPQELYGPPPASDTTDMPETTEMITEESFDPAQNQNEDIYGPPIDANEP